MTRFLILIPAVLIALGSCQSAPDIAALAADPATQGLHWDLTMPWGTTHLDLTRVNSTNTSATANSNGTAVNVPANSTVNPAPQKPVGGTTLTPGSPTVVPGP